MLSSAPPLRNLMLALIRPQGGLQGETLSLAEQIALQVASDVVEGRIEPSARITEVAITDRFQVSRGPVRDALRILDNTGLVRLLPRRGAVVTALSAEEVSDLFEMRAVLFGLAAGRLAIRHDEDQLMDLRRRLADLTFLATREDPKATADYVMAVLEFGNTICHAAGIEQLTAMVSQLFFRTLRYSRIGLSSAPRRRESLANWTRLIGQIEKGDREGAEASARQLVGQSRAEAIRLLDA